MPNIKPWYLSKTIWGSLIAVCAAIGSVFGVDIDAATQQSLSEAALQIATVGGSLLAIFGRLTATSLID